MFVGVAGDWHGNTAWAEHALDTFANNGITVIYHVGDFGFWPGKIGEAYLDAMERRLTSLGLQLLITPGNHDDYVYLSTLDADSNGFLVSTPSIRVIPRGHRWAIDGVSTVSLGGAASINFEDLTEGIDWWREEAISYGDVYSLISEGHSDIMFAHEAPHGIRSLSDHLKNDTSKWSVKALHYASESRNMMSHAVDIVKPKVFFHGHYHKGYVEEVTSYHLGRPYVTKFVGLSKDDDNDNMVAFDAVTGEIKFL